MSLLVIKVGTSILRATSEVTTKDIIESYCKLISKAKEKGEEIVLVSSGAVGLGCQRLGMANRPEDLSSLQATASIGQVFLMSLYREYMNKFGYEVAQILLTRSDFNTIDSYNKASSTLKKLIEWNIIPIVNENDTISDEELKYGDNDTLSALVATAIGADQLILLTDIDKLYSSDPKANASATPISDVHNTKEFIKSKSEESISLGWGTGGINTKLSAAQIATEAGIKVQLADGRNTDSLLKILDGARVGTTFHPQSNPLRTRKSWLAHALHPHGSIYIDNGASAALKNNGASLLIVGITKIKGKFYSNQAVRLLDPEGNEIARGISSLSSEYILNALKSNSNFEKAPIVIHRDVLVLLN